MKKTYETDLPDGYRPAYVINAADNKTGLLLNAVGGGIMILVAALCLWILWPLDFSEGFGYVRVLALSVSMLVYLVLHELVHGAAYKLLTKQKLTFGITLTVAFCGVPQIYVYRKTALISLLAPFVTFTILFGTLMAVLPGSMNKLTAAILLAIHVGGCSGDLYDTILFLFKYRDPKTLMRDTGPEQTFYLPETN